MCRPSEVDLDAAHLDASDVDGRVWQVEVDAVTADPPVGEIGEGMVGCVVAPAEQV